MIKSRGMEWEFGVGERRDAYRGFVGKSDKKSHL
jgi:hypothetical protein